jgi:hypothetical protein
VQAQPQQDQHPMDVGINQTGLVGGAQGNAARMQGIAGGLNGATAGDLAYANQALINAFDPQKQAYNYYLQQALSTAGAQEAQQGINNTPYGAEVTGATGANFANNWKRPAGPWRS